MRYRVEKYAVILAPQNVAIDDMETRIYPVEQSALASIPGGGEDRAGLRDFFIQNGVDFPIGSKIVYDTRISRLIVTNTVRTSVRSRMSSMRCSTSRSRWFRSWSSSSKFRRPT